MVGANLLIFSPSAEIGTIALFFEKVFGNSGTVRGLNFLIALASFGNMIAVIIGLSRRIRECGRQRVLSWTPFWVSTKLFGTTLSPYAVIWALTALMILAIPSGDTFTFYKLPIALYTIVVLSAVFFWY